MDPLLDSLTLAPAAQLFELEPPHYTSSYGRRTEAIFKHNVPPAPMLISPDNGLILYERVISTKAEHQLLDKLTKPKYYHPTPSIHKGGRAGGGSHSSIGGGGASSSPAPRPKSATRRPSSGSSHPTSHVSAGPSHSGPDTDAGSSAKGPAGPASSRAGSGRAGQQEATQHRNRSFSAGRSGPPGVGLGSHVRRKPLYPEDGPLKDYFSKERASVTATTVFTWGNRYKIGDCGAGRPVTGAGGVSMRIAAGPDDRGSFSSYMPMQQKPPLRL